MADAPQKPDTATAAGETALQGSAPSSSRTTRKLLRNKPALFALLIIAVYCLIAIVVTILSNVGLLPSDTEARYTLGDNEPGFYLPNHPEKRVEGSDRILTRVKRARRADNLEGAFEDIPLMSVADVPLDELEQRIERAESIYDELDESDDLDSDPEMLPKVVEFEAACQDLLEPLSGGAQLQRNLWMLLGTDQLGRSILQRSVYSIRVALLIGAITAFAAVLVGSILGAAAGYFGGIVDHIVTWLYTTGSSIPYLVLMALLAYMFTGSPVENTLIPIYVAFVSTFWIGPCRVIRGETLKIKQLEYVQAATTVGFSRMYILLRHVLPNAAHLMLINFSLLFIAAIKGEVILTFLGLGVKSGPSWGSMISQSKDEVLNDFFWQIGAATGFMLVLVLAFNILTDALQDVFDPKHL